MVDRRNVSSEIWKKRERRALLFLSDLQTLDRDFRPTRSCVIVAVENEEDLYICIRFEAVSRKFHLRKEWSRYGGNNGRSGSGVCT